MKRMSGPNLLGHQPTVLDDETTVRVRRVVGAIGIVKAMDRLHVGQATLDAALHRGRMKPTTAARIRKTLDAVEREAS